MPPNPSPSRNDEVKVFQFQHGITITLDEEGAYIVRAPELKGCIAHGYTVHEALTIFKDVYEAWLAEKGQAWQSATGADTLAGKAAQPQADYNGEESPDPKPFAPWRKR